MAGPVAFVLKGYPRLSETFIAQEILALERRGLDIRIVSLRRPTDPGVHPIHREIRAPVLYLPEYLYREALRVLRAWLRVRKTPGYAGARAVWLKDWRRDPTPNRGRRFGQALVLADELAGDTTSLHAHFLHTPASVTRYAAMMRGLPWSCSAHAKDIWTTHEWEKREKLAACAWAVTCTAAALDHLAALAPPSMIDLVYHGLDFTRFPAPEAPRAAHDGSPAAPAVILSVGRAVAKKGYDDMLSALARIDAACHWRFVHIGGGRNAARLKRQAQGLGLTGRIEWRGPRTQADVLAAYGEADLFVLASRVAGDGDRDGLPNVLMEAQSQSLACVTTDVSGIPELVEDGVTGRIVEAGDVAALAGAMAALIRDPAERARLGQAGAARVRKDFSMEVGADRLAAKFALETRRAAE